MRRRYDFIGALSVFGGDDASPPGQVLPEGPDIRMRLAVSASDKAEAELALREVGALYCTGPAGGGGIRTRLQSRINTASYLVPRSMVEERHTFWEGEA